MNYIKKMCILRQVKQGFSGDGKPLSGLVKIEQYGKNLAVEVSIINFAPLSLGEYYCLLSDGKGKTEMLALRGKSLFNILSDIDISEGFCAVVCYVKSDVVPIAYGINGNRSYDWRSILNATLPPVFPSSKQENAFANTLPSTTAESQNEPPMYEFTSPPPPIPSQERKEPTNTDMPSTNSTYNDDTVATENYFIQENENEQEQSAKTTKDARIKSTTEEPHTEKGSNITKNGDADGVLHAFKTDSDGYYRAVKEELDNLFKLYPKDKTLNGVFDCSEWVRLKGTAKAPLYLVGVVYMENKAKYICYALAAENKNEPPEEIKNVCTFVPSSVFKENEGFFVLFQSASTGECIKPERA